ncbi:MAG: hypothetical protein E7371_05830 [Clostridiales bacterium]|nr:hypothetical protein [Clostridiales bacterium]
MFTGMFEHQLDDKNRLRIPSKFKKGLTGELGDQSYCFFRGKNQCICVMAEDELNEMLSSLASEGLSESSKITRAIFGSICTAEEDAQGRVVLPSMLRMMAGIKKDVITLGVGNRLEIWSAERYLEYMSDIDYDAELEKLRI